MKALVSEDENDDDDDDYNDEIDGRGTD